MMRRLAATAATAVVAHLCLLLLVLVSTPVSARLSRGGDDEVREFRKDQNVKNAIIKQQFIVQVSESANQNELLRELRQSKPNSKVLYQYKRVFRGFAVSGVKEATLEALSESYPGSIVRIEADLQVQYPEEELQEAEAEVEELEQSRNAYTWGTDRLDQKSLPLDKRFRNDYDGTGVDIYIIDTGVMASHQQFGGRVVQVKDFTGEGKKDGDGHGTHVAGTAAGKTLGVAPGAKIFGVKVLDSEGSGSTSDVLAGVDWVAKRAKNRGRPSVANLSLGGFISLSMNEAVQNLANEGVIVAVAAGNENFSACAGSPSSAFNVISVGSTTKKDERSSFSNWGVCMDIFAPGTDITSAMIGSDTDVATYSGTSMASPHVAGAAALLLQKDPDATASDLVDMAVEDRVSDAVLTSPNRLLFTNKIRRNNNN